ncbi:hypothetical protein BH11PSE10_BH11PSE10_15150 [soil metagenome]
MVTYMPVMPAQAGIQRACRLQQVLDSSLRWNDGLKNITAL